MIETQLKAAESLEARPAALFVQHANKFTSSIKIEIGNKMVNAKSIMGVIALGVMDGENIKLIIDGEDEKLASEELVQFLTK
ncbi:MAG: HPr family phosphocarrier protein [Firmicutes bacterium]|nr:HPr family phosphocarrier protein [Bacillota bacterium]